MKWVNKNCIEKRKLKKNILFYPEKKVKWKKPNLYLQSYESYGKKSSYEVETLIILTGKW